jgi:phosphate-selective porin OprO/OprP
MSRSRFVKPGFLLLVLVAGVLGSAGTAIGEDSTDAAKPDGEKFSLEPYFDKIWGLATFYENPENPVVKKVAFSGRFHADFPLYDGNRGDFDEPTVRRVRLGLKTQWLADLTLHSEVDIDPECNDGERCGGDRYQGITDAYLKWTPDSRFHFTVGKMSVKFTLDGATSSNRLLTPERNNVAQNLWFPAEYHSGLMVAGTIENTRYRLGAFSSVTDKEFGDFDGGYFTLVSLGQDFSSQLDIPEFLVTVDYVYNESDEQNIATRDLAHVMSLNLRVDTGKWGVRSDLSGGIGYHSQSDLIGFAIMPFYHLCESIQLVTRYTHVHSFDDGGIRFGLYETRIDSTRGDDYNEAFAGLNWFLYGHKFKIQTGLQYTWMESVRDYNGWGWTTTVRMYW